MSGSLKEWNRAVLSYMKCKSLCDIHDGCLGAVLLI